MPELLVRAALPRFDETQGRENRDDLTGLENRDTRHQSTTTV